MKKLRFYLLISIMPLLSAFGIKADSQFEYEGIYDRGMESSTFHTCGGDRYWNLEFTKESYKKFWKLRADLNSGSEPEGEIDDLTSPPNGPSVVAKSFYIHFKGKRHLSGEYGHFGRSKWQITVTDIHDLRIATADDRESCSVIT